MRATSRTILPQLCALLLAATLIPAHALEVEKKRLAGKLPSRLILSLTVDCPDLLAIIKQGGGC